MTHFTQKKIHSKYLIDISDPFLVINNRLLNLSPPAVFNNANKTMQHRVVTDFDVYLYKKADYTTTSASVFVIYLIELIERRRFGAKADSCWWF